MSDTNTHNGNSAETAAAGHAASPHDDDRLTNADFADSITESVPSLLTALNDKSDASPRSKKNLVSLGKGFASNLAEATGDSWRAAALLHYYDWCNGNWTHKSGKAPSTSPGSIKGRRCAAKAVIVVAVERGFVRADSDLGKLVAAQRAAIPASDRDAATAILSHWVPRVLSHEYSATVEVVLQEAREWVAASEPANALSAQTRMRYAVGIAIWAVDVLCTTDGTVVLNPRNVHHWTTDLHRDKGHGWQSAGLRELEHVGRAVCPEEWPLRFKPVGMTATPKPYTPEEEEAFRMAAAAMGRAHRRERLWIVCATQGAGLTGVEAAAVRPGNVADIGDGRLAVTVSGSHPRVVPIRAAYTDLAAEAVSLCDSERLVDSQWRGFVHYVVTKLTVDGLGKLSLRRTRSTFLAAHLISGTPLVALQIIAGSMAAGTVRDLLAYSAAHLDEGEAVRLGLSA